LSVRPRWNNVDMALAQIRAQQLPPFLRFKLDRAYAEFASRRARGAERTDDVPDRPRLPAHDRLA
jgi:hypothetical protein